MVKYKNDRKDKMLTGMLYDATERNKGLEYARPIFVGDNVWIGAGVSLLPGVTIGNDCVIGAGSVVVKDIPPYSLSAGNTCKVIKTINH